MDIVISNTSGVPIYQQIFEQISAQIIKGLLPSDTCLPPIRTVARELRISVITTKRAYEELEREGFLVTVPGKGCFVAPQNPELQREEGLRRVEEHLARAVEEGRAGGISLAEMTETLNILYGDD